MEMDQTSATNVVAIYVAMYVCMYVGMLVWPSHEGV